MNSLCTDTFDKILHEAGRLCKINKKKTLSSREVRGGGAAGCVEQCCAARVSGAGRMSRLGPLLGGADRHPPRLARRVGQTRGERGHESGDQVQQRVRDARAAACLVW